MLTVVFGSSIDIHREKIVNHYCSEGTIIIVVKS